MTNFLRTILIVLLALVFGVAAAVYAMTAANKKEEVAPPEKVKVVIALRSVPRGSALAADMVATKEVLKEDAPADALHGADEAVGRVADKELVKDDYILESKLAPKGSPPGMAAIIPLGMQATTILTPTPANGVGGFIRPGDQVDVFLTVDHFNPNDRGGTVRLMQKVKVLAAENRLEGTQPSADGKAEAQLRFVTLVVSPKQAQVLADGQKRGVLSLILRNPDDKEQHPDGVVTPDDLKFPPRPEEKGPDAPAPRPDPIPPIRVIRAGGEATPTPP